MLHIMAVIRFKSEHAAAVGGALTTLAVNSRSERGCLRYEVFRRMGEDVFVTQETWADNAAEAAHMAGPNVAAAFGQVGAMLVAAPDIHRYSQLV